MIGNFLAIPQEELEFLYQQPQKIASVLYETYAEEVLDIDKAWHGIHFLLTGEQHGGRPPLAHVVFGIEPIGKEDIGYGPALGTPAASVKEIAASVCQISDAEFRSKFNSAALTQADIYPLIWDKGAEALDYIAAYFKELQDFYKNAAEEGNAVITFIN